MILTLEQIRAVALGIDRADMEGDLITLHRFTREQEEMYKVRNQDFYAKTFATSGVMLEFDTDSSFLHLEFAVTRASSRPGFAHTVFVNGRVVGRVEGSLEPGAKNAPFGGSFDLGQGSKRVRVHFPWGAASRIRKVELSDGSTLKAVPRRGKMLVFGDSITQGYDASVPEKSYASQIIEHIGLDGINKAIGGEVFCPELARIQDAFQPEVITVAYGTNDWSKTDRQTLWTNSRLFYKALRENYPQAKIYALAPIWRADRDADKPAGPFGDIPGLFASIVEEIGNAQLIDCIDFLPQDVHLYSDLRLHPNDDGFAWYGKKLCQVIPKE